ncbi:uncharacterized protein LOC124270334 [Haliotis rubra]|uniref:uncharacterized protein LOC124270334 n=1 Tax=Haliotis rubra TaxID=36100 RepID=UPI001EE56AD5|nr:uncharacterized protein LOC124270334 [Haliotis rubra]
MALLPHLNAGRQDNSFPNKQQMAYQESLCSTHASFNQQETVQHYLERGSDVHVLILDSCKAFDSVWHDGLRKKLYDGGVKGKLWTVIDKLYHDMESCVLIGNMQSRWFTLQQGVRQDGVLSARLYLLYINQLLDDITEAKKGALIMYLNTGCRTRADEVALVSSCTCNLISLLRTGASHSPPVRLSVCSG